MEEVQWDRQSFVTKPPPPPPRGSSILGPLLFVVVVSLIGAGGYLYVKNNGIPDIGLAPAKSEMSELADRLDEMNARLEQMERRLPVSAPSRPRTLPQDSSATAASSGSVALRPASRRDGISVAPASSSASSPSPEATPPPIADLTPPTPSSSNTPFSQGESASKRDAWEATTNRLGDAVGELGEQRRTLDSTQETLGQIQRNMERTYLPFDLRKNAGRQRIGPIWLDLRRTDRRAQRYTMQIFFDDKWVEMKDRVLGERLEFYISGVSLPLELVISEIRKDQVVGKLGLPQDGIRR